LETATLPIELPPYIATVELRVLIILFCAVEFKQLSAVVQPVVSEQKKALGAIPQASID
jgi:hypothetical protein